MAWVFADAPKDLKPAEMLVAISLANHASSDGGHAYPSVQSVMDETRLSRRSVQSSLRTLEERGVIVIEKEATPRLPAMYSFCAFRGANPATKEKTGAQSVPQGAQILPSGAQTLHPRGAEIAPKPSVEPSEQPSEEPSETPPTPSSDSEKLFEHFWSLYPKGRGSKKLSRDEWDKLNGADRKSILLVLPAFAACHDWQKEGGKYVKHAERWLKYRGWEDDVPATPNDRASPNGKPMSIMDEITALRAKSHKPAGEAIETTWRTR